VKSLIFIWVYPYSVQSGHLSEYSHVHFTADSLQSLRILQILRSSQSGKISRVKSHHSSQIRSKYSHPLLHFTLFFNFIIFFRVIFFLSRHFFWLFYTTFFTFFLTNMSCSTPEILDDVTVVIFLYLIKSDKLLNKFFFF